VNRQVSMAISLRDNPDITGTGRFRVSVTKELLQESTSGQDTMQTSTLQTTQLGSQITNPVVSLSQSTAEYNRVLGEDESGIQVSGESSSQFAGHVMGAITDVTEREGVRETTTTKELTLSSTQMMQTSSELATAQQMTQSKGLITDTVLSLSRNAVDYIRGSGRDGMERQVSGGSSGQFGGHDIGYVDNVTATGSVREPVKGELVESSMHETTQSSAQYSGQRTELDIAEQTMQSERLITDNHIPVPRRDGMGIPFSGESPSQYGSHLPGEVADVSESKDDREAVAAGVTRESTSTVELAASSTLRAIYTSSELDISQQNTQSRDLIDDTVLTLGDNAVEYTGEHGSVTGEYSAQHEGQVEDVPGFSQTEDVRKLIGEIVQESTSTGTKDITKLSTLQITQARTSSGIEIVQQNTTPGELIADIVPSLEKDAVGDIRESGRDRAGVRVSSTLSGEFEAMPLYISVPDGCWGRGQYDSCDGRDCAGVHVCARIYGSIETTEHSNVLRARNFPADH
jgi:hypothetical protein